MSEQEPRRPSLTSRIAYVLLPRKSKIRLEKKDPGLLSPLSTNYQVGPARIGAIGIVRNDDINEQTGERRDNTAMLHGLSRFDSSDSLDDLRTTDKIEERRPSGEHDIIKLSSTLWNKIAEYLSFSDVICLAISSKTLLCRIDKKYWLYIRDSQNQEEKLRFLMNLDSQLPGHLLCFSCVIYHRRITENERLKSAMNLNPVYNCNGFRKFGKQQPKIRLTSGNFLPFTFVQLATRAEKYTAQYGIPLGNLCRRYKDRESDWLHQTRYYIHKGNLLLRVISQTFAAHGLPISGQRHLLYSREDYWPYFSCCPHWRDGELLDVCKCALSHIAEPHSMSQKRSKPMMQRTQSLNLIGTLCSFCRPIRRCPDCPTEYMVELKLCEDKSDPVFRFKQSLVVTRWSDLGNGSSPFSEEWAAVNGDTTYDSFANLGKRALSGIFEAQFGVTLPGQRLISANPKNEKRGEEGNKWY
ncbi:putative f-box domain protein [Erysiphe neolycopersici]|uniref:Putative f-box domain protein n=1 Tax=Erysiphe neolycopersici TaxID=212602 RepID=A0A420HPC7_9PEZI|nr:putative f-box domain protein [Erysiphe neolycopersici]